MISPQLRDKIKKICLYDPLDERQVIDKAKELKGRTILDILRIPSSKARELDLRNKGDIGNIIQECWFGIPANPSNEPDFPQLGIELKIIPLKERGGSLVVKERTKICSIDYFKLIEEKWNSSHAKKKLEKIIFVYYRYNVDDRVNSKVVNIDVWELDDVFERTIIENDWWRIKEKVDEGKAHELSESLSSILAACRSGQGKGRDLVPQPCNKIIRAQKRSFALKQSFTQQRWRELFGRNQYESIIENLRINVPDEFERKVLERLRSFEGMKLGDISDKLNINIPGGKNAAATIIKKALGFKNVNSRIKEFEQYGITIKVVPVRPNDKMPWESVSFPTFKLKELEEEIWEDASILEDIARILFVPIYELKHPGTDIKDRVMGHMFFWSPNANELFTIQKEWEQYQADIKDGKAKVAKIDRGDDYREVTALKKESQTKYIHVRPHGRDRNDRDVDSHGNSVVKQSFWLNKRFIQKLVHNNS